MPAPLALSRRQFVKLASTTLALGAFSSLAGCIAPRRLVGNGLGLRDLAAQKGKIFGAAVHTRDLTTDPDFARAVARECNAIVATTEMKWKALQPHEGDFNFNGYDMLATFARRHDMKLRGHTFVWHNAQPQWLAEKLNAKRNTETTLETHINTVMRYTGDLVDDWDVVNEAIDEQSPRADGLRESPWLYAMGEDYIVTSFKIAHAANPAARLVYNDFGLEYDNGPAARKRRDTLNMLTAAKKQGAPIHALGLQGHVRGDRVIGGADFRGFLAEVRALGLDVIVTEFDVRGGTLRDIPGVDHKIAYAKLAAMYLDAVQEDAPLSMLLCWGLSDRYTWLKAQYAENTGVLPLDKDLNPAPFHEALRTHWL